MPDIPRGGPGQPPYPRLLFNTVGKVMTISLPATNHRLKVDISKMSAYQLRELALFGLRERMRNAFTGEYLNKGRSVEAGNAAVRAVLISYTRNNLP